MLLRTSVDVPNDFGRDLGGLGDLVTGLYQPAEIRGRHSPNQADDSL